MIILGIDPGLGRTGFGVIDDTGGKLKAIGYGVIETPAEASIARRLEILEQDMKVLLKEYEPDEVAIEEFVPSPHVAHQAPMVLQARGVVLLLAHKKGLPIGEYKANTVKLAVTGDGRAKKGEIQLAITDLLNLEKIPQPDDAADGLGIAYTHHASRAGGLV